jgi:FHS family L-fucose permease-like MFS transporter
VADNLGAITPAFFIPLAGYVVLICFAVACIRTKARTEVTTTVSH